MTSTIPYSQITSVYSSLNGALASITDALVTAESAASGGLIKTHDRVLASLTYYSYLELSATATDQSVKSTAASAAASASSAMVSLVKSTQFFKGNAPSISGNGALVVVMSLFLASHVAFGVMYKQWWFAISWDIYLLLEVIGYSCRIACHFNLDDIIPYAIQSACLTVAPCFTMAGIYYLFSQMIVITNEKFSVLKPRQYTMIFITCDVVAILIQSAGGGIASGSGSNLGTNIMIGGLVFQILAMSVFQVCWYLYLWNYYNDKKAFGNSNLSRKHAEIRQRPLFKYFPLAISVSVTFVYIRSMYRVVEFAEGWNGHLSITEIYFMFLEAMMMALATLTLTFVYPGFVYGTDTKIVIDKGRHAMFSRKEKQQQFESRNPFDSRYDNIERGYDFEMDSGVGKPQQRVNL